MTHPESPSETLARASDPSSDPSRTGTERVILDSAAIERALTRIAHEIVERNESASTIVLVGIARGGVPVAEALDQRLSELDEAKQKKILRGSLDVTLYRDDVIGRGLRPIPETTQMPFSVAGKPVILVEDVVFTGRTVRAAMDAVLDFGRPDSIQVATLVDRGHRELPIRVDFVGKNIPTARAERVIFRSRENGEYEVVVR